MALSAFDDKRKKPEAAAVRETLGRSSMHWFGLIERVESEFPPAVAEWTFGGAPWGWALRLKRKKRAVLYMTPARKHFLVGFALGEKAVRAAGAAKLPGPVWKLISGAQKYAEGRAVRMEVRTRADLDNVMKVARIKMAN
jgi:hypothetical protein